MLVGADAGGDPVVTLVNNFVGDGFPVSGDNPPFGPTIALTGLGSGYHTYQLASACDGAANLFVDGALKFVNYAGQGVFVPSPRLQFGALGQYGTGGANY